MPITFIEHVKNGVSTIKCAECGEVVTAELRHVREHAAREAEPPIPGAPTPASPATVSEAAIDEE